MHDFEFINKRKYHPSEFHGIRCNTMHHISFNNFKITICVSYIIH